MTPSPNHEVETASDEQIEAWERSWRPNDRSAQVFALIARIRTEQASQAKLIEVIRSARQRLQYDGDLFIDQDLHRRAEASYLAMDECDAVLEPLLQSQTGEETK